MYKHKGWWVPTAHLNKAEGVWCHTYSEAKEVAERRGSNRIYWTYYTPQELKLYAVYMFGRWWKNRYMISAVDNG